MDSPFMIVLLVLLGLGAAVGVFIWMRNRPTEEEFCHFNCPGCGRRFRYRPKQIGHKGQCPHCDTRFTFPAPKVVSR